MLFRAASPVLWATSPNRYPLRSSACLSTTPSAPNNGSNTPHTPNTVTLCRSTTSNFGITRLFIVALARRTRDLDHGRHNESKPQTAGREMLSQMYLILSRNDTESPFFFIIAIERVILCLPLLLLVEGHSVRLTSMIVYQNVRLYRQTTPTRHGLGLLHENYYLATLFASPE